MYPQSLHSCESSEKTMSSRTIWTTAPKKEAVPACPSPPWPSVMWWISVVPLPPGSSQEPNTVVSVLQKGYSISDRVLRPALVTVAAAH